MDSGNRSSNELAYANPDTLLGDLRGGLCSSGLCRQLRAVAADEIERLLISERMLDAAQKAALQAQEHGKAMGNKAIDLQDVIVRIANLAPHEAHTAIGIARDALAKRQQS